VKNARGPTLFIVEHNFSGFHVGRTIDTLGLRTAAISELRFENCEVPLENVLGKPGSALDLALPLIARWERTCLLGHWLDIMQASFESRMQRIRERKQFGRLIAQFQAVRTILAYMKERHAFGRPIAHLQTMHARLADMRLEIDAARLIALHAASLMAVNQRAGEVVIMAKIHATEIAVRACDAAMHTFAGWGLSTEYPIERLYRDSLANVPAGLTTDRLLELLICGDLQVDPWKYDPFEWLSPDGLRVS
jgi:alkylation response protein AidB-like acyl-CoA dehydrogenase